MAEPWDDSALINAFNSAIAKYKTMHGIAAKGKALSQDVSENIGIMESDSHVVSNLNEHEVEQSKLCQKEENGGVPQLQTDNPSSHEGQTENNNVEEVPAGYNGYADPQYYAQDYSHSATSDNCYLCQWNAYYHQAGTWTSPADSAPNGLQCQYCGHVNQYNDATKSHHHHQTAHTFQAQPDGSALSDIVKAAVAEALKTADGQTSANVMTESLQTNSSFSDVAVAWFLAGFHTSRYLSQKP